MNTSQNNTGVLYVIATPIGNLEDITFRAIRILKQVDLIAAEDTRHTKKLLNHFGISTKLISYYREREKTRGKELVNKILNGTSIALVSDAGTPGISDPGAILINEAQQHNISIIPVPGPSALTAALSVAGIEENDFYFFGFAPHKKGQRRKLLISLSSATAPLVFYESPHRIESLFADMLDIFGDRKACWAREITKVHEDINYGKLSDFVFITKKKRTKGESVIIISPSDAKQPEGDNLDELLLWYHNNSQLSQKDICRRLATDLGISRSKIYQRSLELFNLK